MKKSISPVVATALLLVVVIIAVISYNQWFNTYSSGVFTDVEEKNSNLNSINIKIEDIIGDNLYIKNTYNNLTISNIKINDKLCDIENLINNTYSKGMLSIDLNNFTSNLTDDVLNIVLITNKGIFSKKIYFKPTTSLSNNLNTNQHVHEGSFITYWNVSLAGASGVNNISLPLSSTGTYNFIVDWGDGTNDTITSYNQPEVIHIFNRWNL